MAKLYEIQNIQRAHQSKAHASYSDGTKRVGFYIELKSRTRKTPWHISRNYIPLTMDVEQVPGNTIARRGTTELG